MYFLLLLCGCEVLARFLVVLEVTVHLRSLLFCVGSRRPRQIIRKKWKIYCIFLATMPLELGTVNT